MTVTIPFWLIACVVGWLAIGWLVNAVTWYVTPYRRKEGMFDDIEAHLIVVAWPLVILSVPLTYMSKRANRKEQTND